MGAGEKNKKNKKLLLYYVKMYYISDCIVMTQYTPCNYTYQKRSLKWQLQLKV